MAIDFPNSPSTNQVFTTAGKSWKWNGTSWIGLGQSSINADTVDGIDSASFLRSDANDTFTGNLTNTSGTIDINRLKFNVLQYDWTSGTKVPIIELTGATNYGIFYHEGSPDKIYFATSGETSNYALEISSSGLFHLGNQVLTTANEGSGNGIDADTVDGQHESVFVRTNAERTITANQTFFGTSGSGSGFRFENIGPGTHGRIAFNDLRFYDWQDGRDIFKLNGEVDIDTTLHMENDRQIKLGPNYNSRYLYLGGPGHNQSEAQICVTNGNIHIDNRDGGYGTYFNWYATGHTGVFFGATNSSSQIAHIDGAGNASFSGQVTASSDRRLKTDIRPIDNALELVCSMNGYMYTKDELENQVGVVAQELEEILPAMVYTGVDDMQTKSVNYGNLVAVLIEAIKEQQQKIQQLEARIDSKH